MRRRIQATPEELQIIREAMSCEKKMRVYKRYQALYLYLSGRKRQEVADIVGLTPDTISILYKTYLNEGLEGLSDKPIPGRPSRLSEEQLLELKEMILHQMPSEVGFKSQSNWTAGLIGKYIEREYGQSYSIRGITGILARMGLSYVRRKYSPSKTDARRRTLMPSDYNKMNNNFQWCVQEHSLRGRTEPRAGI